MKKFLKIIKHSFTVVLSNKPRYFLTALGIVVAIIIFTAGSVIATSFSYKEIEKYNQFDKDIVFCNNSVSSEKFVTASQNANVSASVGYKFYSYVYFNVSDSKYDKVAVSATAYGVNEYFNYLPIPSADSTTTVYKTKIVKGRGFDNADMTAKSKVVIISEILEDLAFDGNAVGKKITIGGDDFEIIGVLGDTKDFETMRENIAKYDPSSGETLALRLIVYVPLSLCSASSYDFAVFKASGEAEYSAQVVDKIVLGKSLTYDRCVANSLQTIKEMKMTMQVMLLLLLIIASSSIAVTMSFSAKERIGEIGIKKAMGATNGDITMQFLFEAIFMAIFTSLIGVLVGLTTGALIIYIAQIGSIKITYDSILLPFLANIFICILSAFIPSIVAAKYNIVDALRFE